MSKNRQLATVLIVDDEDGIRSSLRMILEHEGYEVREAAGGHEALVKIKKQPPDAVFLDIKMPDIDGMEVLQRIHEAGESLPVMMITGHGDVSTAVEATRRGAFDFLEKPLERERVLLSLRNAVENRRLNQEVRRGPGGADPMIGSSGPMQELRKLIERAAPTEATVLITGESGTGKELVAAEIHALSKRRARPMVQVNCAAIPEELIESELFGHEKGSFTGAIRKQVGKFVAADRGTIFLDEVGDMSARTQAKVLRVLQSGELERIGTEQVVRVNVRVIAATNKDLEKEIETGGFREDLFYRLNVVPASTPPLRERGSDIAELADYFLRLFADRYGAAKTGFSPDALNALTAMPWPGNVRELKNLVERLVILSPGEVIQAQDLSIAGSSHSGDAQLGGLYSVATLKEFRELSEEAYLRQKLTEHDWNVTQTAKAISTPRSNLYKKMQQYGIDRDTG